MEIDFEFLLHGVPHGQKIWGNQEDFLYVQNFYNGLEDVETKFLIEIRDVKGIRYCYYSYLKYGNIVDNNNRSGSYFGMTIRLDKYCLDGLGIYYLLDLIYTKYILGLILEKEDTKTRFLVSDFMDINKEISRIKDIVMDLYKNLFSSSENYINDFLSFRIPIEKQYLEKINILDCTSDKLKNIIQKYGIVSLSPFYDTQRVRELSEYFNRKEKSYKEEKEREKDELNSLLIEEKKKNEELSKQINKLKNENSDLENRANRMESDIQNLNNFISNDISNIWHKQLGKALKEIHDCIKDIDIQKNHIPKKHISPKTILLLIGFAFILGVILLCIFLI